MSSQEEVNRYTINAQGAQGVSLMPQGPVTQFFGPQHTVNTRGGAYIESLHVAHLSLTFTSAGGLVDPIATTLPAIRPKPRPVWKPPDYVPPLFVGREAEVNQVFDLLDRYRLVEVYGPAEIGKTGLLEISGANQTGKSLPDGAIFLRPPRTTTSDLLQALHEEFFETTPDLKLTDAQLTRDLQTVAARVVLVNDRLSKEELEPLLAALSSCRVLLSTTERGGRHPGRIRTLALPRLPLLAARELFSYTLERPISANELPGVDALIKESEGRPGKIILAAAIARAEKQVLSAPAAPVIPPPGPMPDPALDSQAQQVFAQLTADQHKLVAALAAVYDARLGKEHLLAIAGVAESSPALPALVNQQIVRTHSPRYSLVETFVPVALAAGAAKWRQQVVDYFVAWMRAPSTTQAQVLEESEAIMVLLGQAIAAGNWQEALQLARAVEPALISGNLWGAWRQVLDWQLQAARAVRDTAAEGWALHQLGTRALCLGDAFEAQRLLNRALVIRDRLYDREGGAVTQHNLNLVLPPPPAGSSPKPASPSGSPPVSPSPPRYNGAGGRPERRGNGCLWAMVLVILAAVGVIWFAQTRGLGNPGSALPPVTTPRAVLPPTKALPTVAPPEPVEPTTAPLLIVNPTMPPDPQINFFAADPQKLEDGQTTYLRWEVRDAISIVIDPYPGEVSSSGELPVQPKQGTTIFVLRATNASGVSATWEVPVFVSQPVVEPPSPVIKDFYPDQVEVQFGKAIQLCYVTENASEVEIWPEIGPLSQRTDVSLDKGCVQAIPIPPPKEELSRYTLTVYDQLMNPIGSRTVEIRVLGPD